MKTSARFALVVLMLAVMIAGCSSKKVDPKLAQEKLNEASKALQNRDLKAAEEALKIAKQGLPNDPQVQVVAGLTAYAKKDLATAAAAYEQAIKLNNKNAEAYNNLGNVLRDQKKFKEAEDAYRKAIELNPGYSYAYTNLGLMLEGQDLPKAIEALKAGVAAMPGDTDMRLVLAGMYQQAGRNDEARVEAETVLKQLPSYKPALDILGQLKK